MDVTSTLPSQAVSRELQIATPREQGQPQSVEIDKIKSEPSSSFSPVLQDNLSSGTALSVAVDVSLALESRGNPSESFAGNVRVQVSFEGDIPPDSEISIQLDIQLLLGEGSQTAGLTNAPQTTADLLAEINQQIADESSIYNALLGGESDESISQLAERVNAQNVNALNSNASGQTIGDVTSAQVNVDITLPENLKSAEIQVSVQTGQGAIESYNPAVERANALNVAV